jgi:hypothetical protein
MHFDRVTLVKPARVILPLLIAAASLAMPSMAPASAGGQASPPIPRGVPLTSWRDNGQGGRYLLQLVKGRAVAPGATTTGIVLSDSDCAPDAQGLNHCHNLIELADGSRVEVINNHVMMRNRCLANGDRLAIRAVNGAWIVADLARA